MIKNIVILSFIIVLIDSLYLKLLSKHFGNLVAKIQKGDKMKFRFLPAIVCYIFLVFSLYYFIILKNGTDLDAAILGWVIYGVFETTNGAIFKDWDILSMVIDTTWGGILYYLTTKVYRSIDM